MPSSTSDQLLRVESRLERLIALALDVDPRVIAIASQPFSVRLDKEKIFTTQALAREGIAEMHPDERKGLIYTPDLRVELTGGQDVIIECKPKNQAELLETEFERVRAVLGRMGYSFRLFNEEHVAGQGLEGNLIRVRDARVLQKTFEASFDFSAVESLAGPHGEVHVGDVLKIWSQPQLLAAIASGVLAVDLRAGPLTQRMRATLAYGDLSHLQILDLEP